MLQIENTFFELGEKCEQDCLIICDRGAMDAAACNNMTFIYISQIETLFNTIFFDMKTMFEHKWQ